jgi:hypothetical protein
VDITVEVEVSTEVKKSMDYMEALIHYIMHHVNSHSKVDSHIAANRQYGSDYSTVVCSDVISLIGTYSPLTHLLTGLLTHSRRW